MTLVRIRTDDPALEEDARALRRSLSALLRVYNFRDRDRICCYDVSVRQSDALDTLVQGGPLSLNDLAAALYLDKSTTSRVVDGLERKGYAARLPNPESGRSILVDVTPEGAALQKQIQRDLLDEEMRLMEDVDPATRRAAARLVARLAEAAGARIDTSGGTCCTV